MSKARLGLIGQTAAYETTGPYVDGLGDGSAKTGYRTAAAAQSAGDLVDGQEVTILIEDASTNRTVWKATYDHGNTRFARVSEILVVGSAISDEAAVDVYVVDDYIADRANLHAIALSF